MLGCFWLPELLLNESVYKTLDDYDNAVYRIFKRDFIDSKPVFNGKEVKIKYSPYHNGKEEAYYHITSKDYYHGDNRNMDVYRCQRIAWIRKFIENADCHKAICKDCSGVKHWESPYKKVMRTKIFLAEERYVVILEDRKTYYMLVTAYYIDEEYRFRKMIEEYNKTKSAP